jgi:hypothetical protein
MLAAAPAVRNETGLCPIHHEAQQAAGTTAAGRRLAMARPVIETGRFEVSRKAPLTRLTPQNAAPVPVTNSQVTVGSGNPRWPAVMTNTPVTDKVNPCGTTSMWVMPRMVPRQV